MVWARMLAYITGTVDQELLLRNEYLAAENHILKAQIKPSFTKQRKIPTYLDAEQLGRLLLSDGERASLAEIAYRLGRKALEEVALVAKPETILARRRELRPPHLCRQPARDCCSCASSRVASLRFMMFRAMVFSASVRFNAAS